HSFNVLLAEDNRINALLTEKALRKAGCSVTTVETGADAIKAFVSGGNEYDLVIVDLNLPDMCGLQVIKTIRSPEDGGSRSRVPVIVLSADDQETAREA